MHLAKRKKHFFFLGFSLWKRNFIKPFFREKNAKFIFLNSVERLDKFNIYIDDEFFLWGNKISKESLIKKLKIRIKDEILPKISFVEDGFIRSVSLGSDLTCPLSLIVDDLGAYVNPHEESKLEHILNFYDFDENLLNRAKKLIEWLKQHKFSKYNGLKHESLSIKARPNQKIILIPAQVEDDLSMILGGFNLSSENFIKQVREENKDAYIIFKIHPDVLSGNRKGLKDEKIILAYCDEILKNVSIDSAINISDEIHTITSTAGFDALLRDKKVVVYGLPFYANWGLSEDKRWCERRKRKLSLEELVAGALILYPRYINAKTKTLCEIEVALDIILKMQEDYFFKSWVNMRTNLRNHSLRKLRRIFEKIVN
ncbi:capsular polysaccharide biosynthesis protein [Campylobacter sp. LR291e]|nr:capsular polysaccharide biosynthesis protein [Campylobacter sp. LR196d]KAA6226207.1 capsular polysaccharide biosynthesis protein [Campylobacter sp. LR185c]KAA6228992.1 capsular polysaccharide biosynthesis protein [Campylobacter sp. LR286c]KAA6231408.1 capsular polysaccharide biosynthesis protein [Campylobacter sp. LR264d]KAA6231620.1 capsular polysaccharide biosynthesis protein [Campylobacter sp. LR291e]